MQTQSLEYGPRGSADVTANIMEAVRCCSVLNEDATPDPGYPLLRVKADHLEPKDPLVKQVHLSYCLDHTILPFGHRH